MNQKQLNRQAEQYLSLLQEAARLAWARACEYEGIDAQSAFVVFSENNPHVHWYERSRERYQEAQAAYRAGGYVGLRMRGAP